MVEHPKSFVEADNELDSAQKIIQSAAKIQRVSSRAAVVENTQTLHTENRVKRLARHHNFLKDSAA